MVYILPVAAAGALAPCQYVSERVEGIDFGTVEVIACGFTDDNFASDPVNCGAILQAVKEWSETLGGYVDTAGLLPNRAVVGGGDYYHFCRESLHLLGGRFFEKYREIRK